FRRVLFRSACLSATSKCSETKKVGLCLSCLRLFGLEPIAPTARQGSEASSASKRLWGLPATDIPQESSCISSADKTINSNAEVHPVKMSLRRQNIKKSNYPRNE